MPSVAVICPVHIRLDETVYLLSEISVTGESGPAVHFIFLLFHIKLVSQLNISMLHNKNSPCLFNFHIVRGGTMIKFLPVKFSGKYSGEVCDCGGGGLLIFQI